MREPIPHSEVFIEEDVLSEELCQDIILRFEADQRKVHSVVGFPPRIDPTVRDTVELPISTLPDWKDVDAVVAEKVAKALADLQESFPGLRYPSLHDTGYRILRYEPGAEYKYHCDTNRTSSRQVSMIFYLNDVAEGGETHFPSHNIKVRARRGRLAAFPPFWTHQHAGLAPIGQRKYVIVAWACI